MASIATTPTRTWVLVGVLALSACTFIPPTFGVSVFVGLAIAAVGLIVVALELAYLAGREIPFDAGDIVRLDNGVEGRVRAVRWGYTIVDTEIATVLVPNHRLQNRRPVRR
ncbi:MAG TPA: hypothetical protein VGM39_26060 [Kofleriaceae bacterium]|jgi:hypothetical protein